MTPLQACVPIDTSSAVYDMKYIRMHRYLYQLLKMQVVEYTYISMFVCVCVCACCVCVKGLGCMHQNAVNLLIISSGSGGISLLLHRLPKLPGSFELHWL